MGKYGVEQITTLSGIDAIRTRFGMYIGSGGQDGIHHITLEILSNSVDEYLNGHCSKIAILYNKQTGYISVQDNGRGVPVGKREDGTEVLEALFTIPHTGAKFTSDGEDGYNTSGGMNGVGAKATNALSEDFRVVSTRDGMRSEMTFAKGIRQTFIQTPNTSKETGTLVTFKPDATIFSDISIDEKRLGVQIQELSYLSKGLLFTFNGTDFKSENGLLDYIDYLNKSTPISSKFYAKATEGKVGVEVALVYNTTYSETCRAYTNNIPNSDGDHLTGFRTAFTRTLNAYAREKKLFKDSDENLSGEDLKEGRVLVVSLKMPDPIFSGQTKDKLNSPEAKLIVERLISQEIKAWLEANPKDAASIINKALLSRKAREAAKKAREATRKTAMKTLSSVLPGKLADCSSKNPSECEIYLVEGK